jgi:hypothetical protein
MAGWRRAGNESDLRVTVPERVAGAHRILATHCPACTALFCLLEPTNHLAWSGSRGTLRVRVWES